jgi:hypothetical protein
MTYRSVFLAWLLGIGLIPVLSSDAKKCQQALLAPLPGIGFISIPSNDVKKCQQAFLAPLPEMGFIPILSNDVKKCQQWCSMAVQCKSWLVRCTIVEHFRSWLSTRCPVQCGSIVHGVVFVLAPVIPGERCGTKRAAILAGRLPSWRGGIALDHTWSGQGSSILADLVEVDSWP